MNFFKESIFRKSKKSTCKGDVLYANDRPNGETSGIIDKLTPQTSNVPYEDQLNTPRSNTEVFNVEGAIKKNRPVDTDWAQQRLKLWQPMLTPPWAIRTTLWVGFIFLVIGIVITIQSITLDNYRVEYDGDHVQSKQKDGIIISSQNCQLNSPSDADSFSSSHTCYIVITLNSDVTKDFHLFYELDNYYQNHRRFVTSWEASQFIDSWKPGYSTSKCEPLIKVSSKTCNVGDCTDKKQTKELFPCGIMANTMFNDIFWLVNGTLPDGSKLESKDLVETGIARNYINNKIKNPSFELDDEKYLPLWKNPKFSRIIPPPNKFPPPNIQRNFDNSTAWINSPPGTGLENEHWRVWIEIAATKRFRKPYGRIEKDLPKGTIITFAVQSNFFVRSFGGSKALVLSKITWFGSENVELGIFFIVVGIICFVAGVLFAIRNHRNPRKPGDASYLVWKEKKKKVF